MKHPQNLPEAETGSAEQAELPPRSQQSLDQPRWSLLRTDDGARERGNSMSVGTADHSAAAWTLHCPPAGEGGGGGREMPSYPY